MFQLFLTVVVFCFLSLVITPAKAAEPEVVAMPEADSEMLIDPILIEVPSVSENLLPVLAPDPWVDESPIAAEPSVAVVEAATLSMDEIRQMPRAKQRKILRRAGRSSKDVAAISAKALSQMICDLRLTTTDLDRLTA